MLIRVERSYREKKEMTLDGEGKGQRIKEKTEIEKREKTRERDKLIF